MRTKLLAIAAVVIAGSAIGATPITRTAVPVVPAVPGVPAVPVVPVVPDVPGFKDIVIPAGTILPVTLDSYVASDSSRLEDQVRARLRRSIVVNGTTVLPAGSALVGHVTRVQRSGRVSGRGVVAFRFNQVTPVSGDRVSISTSTVSRLAKSGKSRDIKTVAIPGAGGAVIGAIAGGKKGAAIGAATGAGAGTGVVLATRGPEVRLGRGYAATVRLLKPITIRVRA